MLELQNLNIGYRDKPLYRVDSVQLEPGLHVLIGGNGAGKTTLMRAILDPTSEGISLNGKALLGQTEKLRAHQIAFVESTFAGLDYLTLKEYLELGRYPYTGTSGRLSDQDERVISQYAAQFKLESLLHRSTASLSDGERQRSSIARGFIQQTPVILLDEPTAFLDYPSKRSIVRQLAEVAGSEDKILLTSSHDLEVAIHYATSLLIIDPRSKRLLQMDAATPLDAILHTAFPD